MKGRVSGFSTKEGVEVNLSRGVTLIIGPNNVEKSLLLGELFQAIHDVENGDYDSHQIVRRRSLVFGDALVQRVSWINEHLPNIISQSAMFLDPSDCQESDFGDVMQAAVQKNVLYLSHHGRSLVVNECAMYDTATQQPEAPLQHLYESKELEREISKATQEAFDVPIIVNRLRGSMVSLHLENRRFTGSANSDKDKQLYINSLLKIDD